MRLTAISGYLGKGPACFLLEISGRRLLLDCGEGPDEDRRPDLSGIGTVDAVLISHVHADHIGALDLLPALGSPPIWATEVTERLGRLRQFGTVHPLPLAGHTTVCGLDVETGRAGHAPGGVWMRIGGADGLLYTGDFTAEGLLYRLESFPRARLLVADASYGAYGAPLVDGLAALDKLAATGPLLLPAPAGGRGLEMAVHFHEAGFAIGLCPAHLETGDMLLARADILDEAGRKRLAAALAAARRLDELSAPAGVAIAAAANADSGLAARLVPAWNRAARIVFTGHRARGTPSWQLVQEGAASFQRWNVHPPLPDLLALFEAVRPEAAMPAFIDATGLDPLLPHLPSGLLLPVADDRHGAVIEVP